jgi:hypothetical protein
VADPVRRVAAREQADNRNSASVASSPAPPWPTGSWTACCRSTAAWATRRSSPSSAGTARSACCIFEGTDEIQRRTIARNLIKGHTKVGVIGG